MSEWQSMETAPIKGEWILAQIPGHGKDNIITWITGVVDFAGNDCCGWTFITEQEPPDCWTDGFCWESNEDNKPSVKPISWMELEE